MSISKYDSDPTSNDLLDCRIAENTLAAVSDQVVAQSAEDIPNIENAPAVSNETVVIAPAAPPCRKFIRAPEQS